MLPDNQLFNADGLVLSSRDVETMNGRVVPGLEKICVKTTVQGFGGKPIACRQYAAERPRGTVLVLHGFTENAFKFSELFHSLLRNGYSVLAYDQRGHGDSWRAAGLPDTSLTHVDSFEDYVKDLEIVCDQLLGAMPKPRFIFAHSMGGAVASLFLERHQGVFKKAALCSPMIAPNAYGVPAPAARLLCAAAKLMGKGAKRPFMSKPYDGPEDFDTSCATSRERFEWYDQVKAATPLYQNSNPSYGWTYEALGVTKKLLAPGEPERIDCPVLLFTAEHDGSVLPGPQEAFIRRVKDGSHALVKGARHEIYRSTDAVFFPWWHEILAFLEK